MSAPADLSRPPETTRPESAAGPTAPTAKPAWGQAVRRQASTVSAKLTPLARQAGDRIAAASPMTLLAALLGLLTILSIVAALSSDTSLGATSTVLFVPAFSAALGALAMRGLIVRRRDQALADDARHDATELRQLEHTLDYIDTKLDAALTQFGSERHNDAVVAMFQAKAATELYRGAAELDRRTETRYALADFLTPAALQAGERAERPAGLSLI
ncbi:hypothetical protein [Mycobacterium sp. 1274756.6]|uniref:hypothetical protein n=1 Tax=Mycobacterium sp. 1274756.6 TaxID=1834076 RepID=UPI000AEA49E9|nr:hypothetical protein [Mycobacterium sp. 1274756.6]